MLEVNNIYQGDCIEVMESIDYNSIDFILCDLQVVAVKPTCFSCGI